MFRFFVKILFLLITMLHTTLSSASDSTRWNTFNSKLQLHNTNRWLTTANAAGIFFNTNPRYTSFEGSYELMNGAFHKVHDTDNGNLTKIKAEGYNSINDRLVLYGNFSYQKTNKDSIRWNATYDPYKGSPYIIADTLTGASYTYEDYNLQGKAAFQFSDSWIIGGNISYYAAIAAKALDPRPENTVNGIDISPSLIYQTSSFKIGFNIGIHTSKEVIDYKVEKTNFNYSYFYFKGFGFYTRAIDQQTSRYQSQNNLYAALQIENQFNDLKSLTEIQFNKGIQQTDDERVKNKKLYAGDWESTNANFSQHFKWTPNKVTHLLDFKADFLSGKGIEYTQNKKESGDLTEYITIAKNKKYTQKKLDGKLDYTFLKKHKNGFQNWMIKITTLASHHAEKYYYIPEIFSMSYFNLGTSAMFHKNFYPGKFHFCPTIKGQYFKNINKKLVLHNDPEITKYQQIDLFLADFNYNTTDVFQSEANLKIGYSHGDIKSIDQVYVDIGAVYTKPTKTNQKYLNITFKLGVLF
ncbi:DUF6850 family outer membrane beta-barrel protein [Sunxiuqinia elliptica]